LADIPQMGFGPTQNLTRFLFFDKPRCRRGLFERVVAGRVAIEDRILPNLLSSRRTSPLDFARTRNTRTPYPVDAAGGGRNSAIIRKMSANRFRGMATSAIWKAT
jgi:hypothetical protein